MVAWARPCISPHLALFPFGQPLACQLPAWFACLLAAAAAPQLSDSCGSWGQNGASGGVSQHPPWENQAYPAPGNPPSKEQRYVLQNHAFAQSKM